MIHDAPVIIADSVLGIVPRVILAILRIVAAKICAAILVTGKLVCVGIGLAEDAQIFAVFIGAVQSFHQAVWPGAYLRRPSPWPGLPPTSATVEQFMVVDLRHSAMALDHTALLQDKGRRL